VNSLSSRFRTAALTAAMGVRPRRLHSRLIAATFQPREAQEALLKRLISANAETEFGRQHNFSRIKSIGDYRTAVPIQSYEDLRPFVERQDATGAKCLTLEPPVYYHRTSGTVGRPKDIPVTKSGLKGIRRHQQISGFVQAKGSKILEGRVFGITGPAVEGRMPSGRPFGSASGMLYERQSAIVRSRYVLPAELSAIDDYDARYFAMAVFGLLEPYVSCLASANPSTLTRLLSVINERADELLEHVATGRLPEGLAKNGLVAEGLRADSARARDIERILKAKGRLDYKDIWPNLRALMSWTGGSCAIPLRNLTKSLPDDCRVVELGYIASELRGTVNIDGLGNACVPMLLDTYFEFAEREAWESGRVDFLSLPDLDVGREYYVFVTTVDGLYRYDMNDILRVTGKKNATLVLEFVQKGKGVTNITGEKVYEGQILEAVTGALAPYHIHPEFFVVLADQEDATYRLFLEAERPADSLATEIASAVEKRLRASNIEYDGKLSSGRLSPLEVLWLPAGTGNAYRAACTARGQRDAQFKYLHLQYSHECPFDFAAAAKGAEGACVSHG